jgi:4-azaleucine resistance transporter AzlC
VSTAAFRLGFQAIVPLWLGMVPFALAYAVSARAAGLSVLDTQLMSALVFGGASQFSAVGMFSAGASGLAIVFTTFLINLRHLLYGLNLGRQVSMTPLQQAVGAHFLTDEAFGVVVASGRRSFLFLLGAELSLFVVWNATTLAGALLSSAIPDPAALGVDFVFPLAFLALLIPLLGTRTEWLIALGCGLLALLLNSVTNSGVTVLVTGIAGALAGALLTGGFEDEPDSLTSSLEVNAGSQLDAGTRSVPDGSGARR